MRWLAHEINSLLDGSMRSIRLAETALRRSDDGDPAEVLARLRTAQEAMNDMAAVLERVMAERPGGPELLRSDRTLGDQVARLRALLLPLAEQNGIDLDLTVDGAAAALPAGLLAPVLANGVRNAIEACGTVTRGGGRVEGAVTLEGDRLVILITDNGPGLSCAGLARPGLAPTGLAPTGPSPPGATGAAATAGRGHGIGLAVCRDIVDALGGTLELMNVPFGAGAVLRVIIPRTDGAKA